MSIISSYTGFQPLEEVWLGGIYPDNFYDHFDNNTQDIFCKINELTNTDLKQIEQKLIELGISVCRPRFDKIEDYLDESDKLIKPPITPRDWAITIGTTLYIIPQYYSGIEPFQCHLDRYRRQQQNVVILDRSIPDPMCYIVPPSVVRVGKDLYIDYLKDNTLAEQMCELAIESLSKFYRVHVTHTGDHSDAVFCPVAPGHIFSTFYRKTYHDTFPNWDIFFLTDTAGQRLGNGYNGSWWLPGIDYPHVNAQVTHVADAWIGNSRETIFEVNMLVIDEKNVICIAEDDVACRKLENLGITPHVVNFKTRGFWDGGIHCLTTDIKRTGGCIDYWPDRGELGIYRY
jgi:hypothetical protein